MRPSYRGHRFPAQIISHAVWLYHQFTLSFRDVEDLLAERGIIVSYEAIRFWCLKFGSEYAQTLRKKRGRLGDIWHVDELFVKIQGHQLYLWRAVDQDGDVLEILVTKQRNKRGRQAVLSQSVEEPRKASVATRHRQTEELSCRSPRRLSIS